MQGGFLKGCGSIRRGRFSNCRSAGSVPGSCRAKSAYYVPSGEEPPKDNHTGRLLFLLAQLNFAELPRLADFPEHGLLQFFIAGDDLYGCDFDHATEQVSWAVRYVEDLPEPEEISPKRMFEPDREEDDLLPLGPESLYKLTGEPGTQAVTPCDYRMDACLREYCADLLPAGVQSFYDLGDEVCETLQDLLETYACQAGGYPGFTQWDPKEREKKTTAGDTAVPARYDRGYHVGRFWSWKLFHRSGGFKEPGFFQSSLQLGLLLSPG